MPSFDYEIIDGANTTRKIRGEDLGTDGNNVQIIGHKFKSDEVGAVGDPAAADEAGSATMIALLKGALRELIAIAQGAGGGSAPAYVEGRTNPAVTITASSTTLVEIDCRGYKRLSITLHNIGSEALDSFSTNIRTNSSFNFHFPEVNSTAGYTSNSADLTGNATAIIRKSSGNPTILAPDPGPGHYVWIRLNVEGIESIQFTANTSVGSTQINAWWILE